MGEAGLIPLEETVAPADVPLTILEHNLYGIDIDRRATQIATLALYLKARQAGLSRSPRVNIVAADASYLQGDAWERFLAGFEREPSVRRVLAAMAGYLKDIRELGSLLRPEEELKRLIAEEHKHWQNAGRPQQSGLFPEYESPRQQRLAFEQVADDDDTFWQQLSYRAEAAIQGFYDDARASGDLDEQIVAGEAQRGFAFLELCQRRYDIVCTNPPYMGSKNMTPTLKSFVEKHYAPGKRDLYTAFILRCRERAAMDAYIAMVTQQSWMYLRSFAELRVVSDSKRVSQSVSARFTGLLRLTSIETLAHLGPGAFEEISGEVVNIVLFTMRNTAPSERHKLTALRATRAKSALDKATVLKRAQAEHEDEYECNQLELLTIQRAPVVYWLLPKFSELLRQVSPLTHISYVRQGICTTDNPQFVRFTWEIHLSTLGKRWFRYAKGGGTRRWSGFNHYVVDWENNGYRVKRYQENTPGAIHWSGRMPDQKYFFKRGWTFSRIARGVLAVRDLSTSELFSNTSPAAIPYDPADEPVIGFWLNTRLSTYLLRALNQNIDCQEGYVQRLPVPTLIARSDAERYIASPLAFQNWLSMEDPTEWQFFDAWQSDSGRTTTRFACEAVYTSVEGWREGLAAEAVGLTSRDITKLYDDTGTPAGWHPLIASYDALPDLPADLPPVPQELIDYLANHQRVALAPESLARLKDRLRALYIAGPGAKVEVEAADDAGKNGNGESNGEDDDEEGAVALGARIPIPAETFLEELSQKLEVHPISVYWLLEQMRRDEALVCPPEMKRQMEDYASVTLLRELGFRWPEQDAYEAEHGPILDPALVTPDGILPLVDCGAGATAAQQLRLRLERDFGEEGAAESETEFRKWVGRPLDDWLRRDFFKRHIQQFKQRPIAWHFVSPQKTFEAFVLYHKLCDESTSRETLHALRTQYAGGLITRLRAEQDRARSARDEREVTRLQLAIEDVEEFRERLAHIERGDDGDLKARIRCRWKGDEAQVGRPGPYAPDINDGVKVNVRPFQELALLATPVIKKWD